MPLAADRLRALRTGKITEFDVPRTGEEVIDPEFGRGKVASQPKGGGLWVQFPDMEGLMFYTYRRALDEWRLFPRSGLACRVADVMRVG